MVVRLQWLQLQVYAIDVGELVAWCRVILCLCLFYVERLLNLVLPFLKFMGLCPAQGRGFQMNKEFGFVSVFVVMTLNNGL